jgi:hypothetical protein
MTPREPEPDEPGDELLADPEAERATARGIFEQLEQPELEQQQLEQPTPQEPPRRGRRRGRRTRQPHPHPSQSGIVIIESTVDLETPVQQAIEALVAQGEVYRRDRKLVVADRSVMLKTRQGERPHLALRALDVANLQRYLARAARFVKRDEEGHLIDKEPSAGLCRRLLDYVGDRSMGLPTVNGVVTAPFLRPDLTLCSTPGYDQATGIFYDPCGRVFPAMPTLTSDNAPACAQKAIRTLARPFRGYTTATSKKAKTEPGSAPGSDHNGGPLADVDGWDLRQDLDRTVMIASLPTLVTAPATRLRPATMFDAPTVGSGKTRAAEVALIALYRQPPGLIPCDNLDVDPAETGRTLRAALLAGTAGLLLDNVRGEVRRIPYLPVLLTGEVNTVRPYHTLDWAEIINVFAVHLTGNNARLGSELGRRILMARIDTGEERPDRVAFDFDPLDEAMVYAEDLVIAALTVVRAYIVAGRPKTQGVPFGSFEEWAHLVRDSLMWAGLPDIVLSIDESFLDDSENDAIKLALDQLVAAYGDNTNFSAGEVARRCAEREIPGDDLWQRPEGFSGHAPWRHPELREALGTALEYGQDPKNRSTARLNQVSIGRWFSHVRGKPVGGLKLVRPTQKKGSSTVYRVQCYQTEKKWVKNFPF